MRSGQPSKSAGWFTGRTRLITIVSIVAVGLAGATAVSANIGILDSASDSPVGNASVTGDLGPPSTRVVDVYLPDTATGSTSPTTSPSTLPSAEPAVQRYAVDVAGTVAVASTDTGIRLDQVAAAPGWSWALAQSDPSAMTVTMTNGARTFEFTATTTADGTMTASVVEPIVKPAPVATAGGYPDDHGEAEEYDGGEDDD